MLYRIFAPSALVLLGRDRVFVSLVGWLMILMIDALALSSLNREMSTKQESALLVGENY